VIRKLRGFRHESDVDEEVNNFISASMVHKTQRGSAHSSGAMWDLCMNEKYRVLLVAAIGLQMSQQLCGINAVFYYSTAFFEGILDSPLLGTCLVNVVNVAATFVALKLMDNTHRRTLLLWSSGGMFLSCLLLMAASLGYTEKTIALAAVMLFVTFFEIGLGPIPWLITTEYFDSKYVATAMSLASIVNWGCNFLVGLLFPYLQQLLGPYTFLPFAVVLAITFVFTLFYVTESYGCTVDEIYRAINMTKHRGGSIDNNYAQIKGQYEMIDGVFE
jgi:SP family facilitated glucose transporter-like MFS transporter 3